MSLNVRRILADSARRAVILLIICTAVWTSHLAALGGETAGEFTVIITPVLFAFGLMPLPEISKMQIWRILPVSTREMGQILWWRSIGIPLLLSLSLLVAASLLAITDTRVVWSIIPKLLAAQVTVLFPCALGILVLSPWIKSRDSSIVSALRNGAMIVAGIGAVSLFVIDPGDKFIEPLMSALKDCGLYVLVISTPFAIMVGIVLYHRSELWLWALSAPTWKDISVPTWEDAIPALRFLSGWWVLFPIVRWLAAGTDFVVVGSYLLATNQISDEELDVVPVLLLAAITIGSLNPRLPTSYLVIRSLPLSTGKLTLALQSLPAVVPIASRLLVAALVGVQSSYVFFHMAGSLILTVTVIELAVPLVIMGCLGLPIFIASLVVIFSIEHYLQAALLIYAPSATLYVFTVTRVPAHLLLMFLMISVIGTSSTYILVTRWTNCEFRDKMRKISA